MTHEEILTGIDEHCTKFFDGHDRTVWSWKLGPIADVAPWFKVLRYAPGPRTGQWAYVSVGASLLSAPGAKKLEFILLTENETPRAIELLAMITHYHHDYGLDMFHSLPVGQPWLDGANCDHLLVSLPYPLGPDLEVCCLRDEHVQILWLLPITSAEAAFKKTNGVDALEEKFDEAAIEYWRIDRESVV